MIHLVHFWLKEEYQTPEHRATFERALTDLCKIPLASKASWGTPAAVPARPVVDDSWDYNLVTYFDTIELHNDYQVHPDHKSFIEECKPMWEKVYIIDSELQG